MEVILFASLYQAKEVLIFHVHFFNRRTFYLCGAAEVVFPFFHMKKASAAKNSKVLADFFSSPVVGLHSVGRFISGRFCRVCLGTGEFLRPQGATPMLIPPSGGWVYCLAPEAPQKGECRRGRRYFWPCRTRVGFGPATGPTLKTALCHIRALVGRNDKYRGPRGLSRNLCMAQTLLSRSSHNPAYVPGPTFGFVKLPASSGSHCTKWADEQHRPAGFESLLVPDLPLPFIPTLIGPRAFDHVSGRVWWEAATNKQRSPQMLF